MQEEFILDNLADDSEHSQTSASDEIIEGSQQIDDVDSSDLEDVGDVVLETLNDSDILVKLDEINSTLLELKENHYNQSLYDRDFQEYYFGISALVLLLIVARLLYKLINNLFLGGI